MPPASAGCWSFGRISQVCLNACEGAEVQRDELNILIVDDDAGHARSVRELLAAHNYPADIRTSGAEGVEALIAAHAAGNPFQVLLLDLHIPDLAGVDVLKRLNEEGLPTKTIILSGERELSAVTPILQLGAVDYLRKPTEPAQLVTSVANALQRFQLEADKQAMQKEARNNAELYGFLLSASPNFVYMLDPDGHFRYVNHQLDGIFEDQPEKLEGQPWRSLFPAQPELASTLDHKINERRTNVRATLNHEFEFTTELGSKHALELSSIGLYEAPRPAAEPEFVGTYGIIRDITESKRTRQQLQQSQRKFYSLFVDSPDAVFISNLQTGHIIERNPQFATIQQAFGAAQDSTDSFLWSEDHPRVAFIAGLQTNPASYQQLIELCAGDEMRVLEIRARRLELEGEPCMIATLTDRTAERSAERDRLALQKQLEQASRMEAIGQVAGGIAHDFNNILASIIGYAELVMNSRSRLTEEQVHQYLEEVVTAGHRARDLISQMLTFTRAKRGEPQATDVTQTITDVSKMLRAAIPSTIELHNDYALDLPSVLIDPVQLQQVVINLLINARDAITGNGSIFVSVHATDGGSVCRTCGEAISGPHVEISVRDDGHGIPQGIIDRIFEMYFSTREPGKGTGIGLWMINNLVHEHGGHVTVETQEGRGTDFRVFLPVTTQPSIEGEAVTIPAPRLNGRIMVVDDEVSVANFIGEVLRDKGFPTVVFNDSPHAMTFLENNLDSVALVLTDGSMPLISGTEIAEYVKTRSPDTPVIFITAYAQQHSEQALARIGVNRYLQKPFSIEEMLTTVNELLNVRDGRDVSEASASVVEAEPPTKKAELL